MFSDMFARRASSPFVVVPATYRVYSMCLPTLVPTLVPRAIPVTQFSRGSVARGQQGYYGEHASDARDPHGVDSSGVDSSGVDSSGVVSSGVVSSGVVSSGEVWRRARASGLPVVPAVSYYDADDGLLSVTRQSVYLKDSFYKSEMLEGVEDVGSDWEGGVYDAGYAVDDARGAGSASGGRGSSGTAGGLRNKERLLEVRDAAVGAFERVVRTNAKLKYRVRVDIGGEGAVKGMVRENWLRMRGALGRGTDEVGVLPHGKERVRSALEHANRCNGLNE